jgi:capsid protein
MLQRPQARFQTSSGYNRSSPAFTAQNIYREHTPAIRRTLVDDSRDLYDNAPFYRGIIERLVTYVIGSGLWPYSSTGIEAFDKRADSVFQEFAEHCELRGGTNWPMLQAQLYRAELVSGDSGTILTSNDFKQPKVVAIDGVDIGSRYRASLADYFDGVWLGRYSEPIAYDVRFCNPLNQETFERVDRRNFIHQFDPERPGQIRGIPLLAAAFPTARDLHDIFALYKQVVKNAAAKTDIITTESGEIDPDDVIRTGGTTLNGSDDDDGAKFYREQFGAEAKIIKPGDKWESYKSDAPKENFTDFMDWLGHMIILAARIPPSAVLQIKVGGADTRRDIAVAARVFSSTQDRIARQLLRIRNYVIEYVMGRERLPEGWRDAVAWQMPKSPTVDSGREAQQDREDVKGGYMSRQEFHGRWGTNWRRHEDQIDAEAELRIVRAQQLAEKTGVPFELALQIRGSDSALTKTTEAQQVKSPEIKPNSETPKQADTVATDDVQKTALNGAQLQAVNDAVAKVSSKQLSPDAAKQMLYIALPATDKAQIDAMIDAAANFTPAVEETAPAQPKGTTV